MRSAIEQHLYSRHQTTGRVGYFWGRSLKKYVETGRPEGLGVQPPILDTQSPYWKRFRSLQSRYLLPLAAGGVRLCWDRSKSLQLRWVLFAWSLLVRKSKLLHSPLHAKSRCTSCGGSWSVWQSRRGGDSNS
jgi:hypothetical protein